MIGLREWILLESSGHYYFIAYLIAIVVLAAFLKQKRTSFVLPAVLITIAVVNPLFYSVWDGLDLYAYWRILWVVPVIPVCAAVPAMAAGRFRKLTAKAAVAVCSALVLALLGSFVYTHKGGAYTVPAPNLEKLPDYVIRISDDLLQRSDAPRVVAEYPVGVYMRQYTPRIVTMYGRDIEGYILKGSDEAFSVHYALRDPESSLDGVAEAMLNNEYDYLVLKDAGREEKLKNSGFELLDHVAGYGIYLVHGNPTVIKEKNELGQVIRATNVDQDGTPVNDADGVSVTSYTYDDDGYMIREFRTDAQGNPAVDRNGYAGFDQSFDAHGNVAMYRTLGPDAQAKPNRFGYAEYRRTYKKKHIVEESYYDELGQAVERRDLFYARKTVEWKDDHIVAEHYFDAQGKPVLSCAGYASLTREYANECLISESYFGTDGAPVLGSGGYASVRYVYDAADRLIRESYFGTDGRMVSGINGYAVRELEYDADGRICCERYLDASQGRVVTGAGYAEVRRIYDADGRLTAERYFGPDGGPLILAAGYAGIGQSYDEQGRLTVRTYLDGEGNIVSRTDGYAKAVWLQDGNIWNIQFEDAEGEPVPMDGLNLAMDVQAGPDGWSPWIFPRVNASNVSLEIGTMNLGEKQVGDTYACCIEIEFADVAATDGCPFLFWAQGAADHGWTYANGWSNQLVYLKEPPEDGVYVFESVFTVNESMTNVSTFDLGFRCDYWGSGRFRVRNVKVERGSVFTPYLPGI